MGTGRLFVKDPQAPAVYTIGRLAILPEARGRGYGKALMAYLEREARRLGGRQVCLCAQTRAMGFYRKCGYRPMRLPPVEEEGIPHRYMKKSLLFRRK